MAKPNLTWEETTTRFLNSFLLKWSGEQRFEGHLNLDQISDFVKTHFVAKSTLRRVLKQAVGEEVITHSVLGTEIDRAFVRGFNQAIKEARQRIEDMGLEEGE